MKFSAKLYYPLRISAALKCGQTAIVIAICQIIKHWVVRFMLHIFNSANIKVYWHRVIDLVSPN